MTKLHLNFASTYFFILHEHRPEEAAQADPIEVEARLIVSLLMPIKAVTVRGGFGTVKTVLPVLVGFCLSETILYSVLTWTGL